MSEVQFTVTGGTGSFAGVSGVVSPGIQPFTMDPDDVADTPYVDKSNTFSVGF